MTLRNFIKTYRADIDRAIAQALKQSTNPRPNDGERLLWILSDEGLYNWARSEGVKI